MLSQSDKVVLGGSPLTNLDVSMHACKYCTVHNWCSNLEHEQSL